MRIDGFGSGRRVGPGPGPSREWVEKVQKAFDEWKAHFKNVEGREPNSAEARQWVDEYSRNNPPY